MPEPVYDHEALHGFAQHLLEAAGLASGRAATFATVLLEGDLLGHTTHGLAQLPAYLTELTTGRMRADGDPVTLNDRGGTVLWDGRRLPGPWLVVQAIELAAVRAAAHGTGTVVIRHSHHIACLAAYLRPVTERGLAVVLMSSDPSVASVAPFGGTRPLFTPNPLAAGFPTTGDPVLIDISASTTTNGLTGRLRAEGRTFAQPWLLDAEGQATTDPNALFTDPPGSILPLGGLDSGHKGFALGLLVEALTSALGGYGRADAAEGWGASVYVQVIDPAAFGGTAAFMRETGWLADAARANPPMPGSPAVRMPGARGLAHRRQQMQDGVQLYHSIIPALRPWAERFGASVPPPLS